MKLDGELSTLNKFQITHSLSATVCGSMYTQEGCGVDSRYVSASNMMRCCLDLLTVS